MNGCTVSHLALDAGVSVHVVRDYSIAAIALTGLFGLSVARLLRAFKGRS